MRTLLPAPESPYVSRGTKREHAIRQHGHQSGTRPEQTPPRNHHRKGLDERQAVCGQAVQGGFGGVDTGVVRQKIGKEKSENRGVFDDSMSCFLSKKLDIRLSALRCISARYVRLNVRLRLIEQVGLNIPPYIFEGQAHQGFVVVIVGVEYPINILVLVDHHN